MDQLSLFDRSDAYRFPEELLEYFADFLSQEEAEELKDEIIKTTEWKETSIRIYDKLVKTPRLIAWYADPGRLYQLAGKGIDAMPWTPALAALRFKVEDRSRHRFNSVLLNYYRDENDSVAWHRDKESELGSRPVIASVSLGQVRNFEFRAVDDHRKRYSLPLDHGSLLLMKGDLQVYWEHRISKSPQKMMPRINLTFRQIRTAN